MDKSKRTSGRAVPEVKLVAEMPGDEEMREHLDEMRLSDGYPGSCGIGAAAQSEAEPEQDAEQQAKRSREERVSGFEQCRELE